MGNLSEFLQAAATAHQQKKERPHVAGGSSVRPQTKKHALHFSDEQEAALACSEPRIVLSALAGAGKTSFLLEYARRRPQKKWTFLTLTRASRDDVRLRAQAWGLPESRLNVRTVHSLAYAVAGHKIAKKIDTRPLSWARVSQQWTPAVAIWKKWGEDQQKAYGGLLLDSLGEFIRSAHEEISDQWISDDLLSAWRRRFSGTSLDKKTVVEDLESLWSAMMDPRHACPVSPDAYVKRFCLAGGRWPSAFWMLDEAQDWPDCIRKAWMEHVDHGIRAGDPFQQLYAWRTQGSCPWVAEDEKEYWLTRSHRQGVAVEPWVNQRLRMFSLSTTWRGSPEKATSVSVCEDNAQNIVSFSPDMVLSGHWKGLLEWSKKHPELHRHMRWMTGVPSAIRKKLPVPTESDEGGFEEDPKNMIMGTIHAAKGREANRVWIMDGATDKHGHDGDVLMPHRLAYVALTRGREAVRVPSTWKVPGEEGNPMEEGAIGW